ncbi:MAG TPA: putative peptidoglycan glycosyltransferase FtsW [Solirubrobacteraceae bacterium]|nr:putative peptidoglycan glycosyltransferase FtsW [Solirubrobacteraceae bacterium]
MAEAPSPRGRRSPAGTSGRGTRRRSTGRRVAPPIEHRILLTATLCLLAFGAVMVYSASSPLGALGPGGGSGTGELIRYLAFGAIGLVAMQVLERRGLALLDQRLVRLMLMGSFVLLLLVMVPGFGVDINGARRWFSAGPIQFQPSELMKITLVLYVVRYLADNPRRFTPGAGRRTERRAARPPGGWHDFRLALGPVAVVAGPALLLIVAEPDLGTAIVIALTIITLMLAAGMPLRYLGIILGGAGAAVLIMALIQPYQMARLTSFLNPWASKSTAGFQSVQGQIALGSGGLLGVGLGKSVQKIYYLPEAQTDFILAVIGEELGVLGIAGVVCLYGMIAYAGLRTARRAVGRYAKLLATGLTSLILCQGILNIFVVLGLAPLTGVPLPFISYAPTNLCVMLASVGVLLNLSRPGARRLKVVDGPPAVSTSDRERRRRERGERRAGASGGRRRAS